MSEFSPLRADVNHKDVYGLSLKIKKKFFTFYGKKAAPASHVAEKNLLLIISLNEGYHYRIIEGIREFLSFQPKKWQKMLVL